jgi:hypothetical protein
MSADESHGDGEGGECVTVSMQCMCDSRANNSEPK